MSPRTTFSPFASPPKQPGHRVSSSEAEAVFCFGTRPSDGDSPARSSQPSRKMKMRGDYFPKPHRGTEELRQDRRQFKSNDAFDSFGWFCLGVTRLSAIFFSFTSGITLILDYGNTPPLRPITLDESNLTRKHHSDQTVLATSGRRGAGRQDDAPLLDGSRGKSRS